MKISMRKSLITILLLVGLFSMVSMSQSENLSESAKELSTKIKSGNYESILETGKDDDKTLIPYLKSLVAKADNGQIIPLKVRVYAQMALAKLGEKRYFDEIKAEVNDSNPDIQDKAIEKLGYVANDDVFQIFYQLLDDKTNRTEPISKELLERAKRGEVIIDIVDYGSKSEVVINTLYKITENLPEELKADKYNAEKWKKWLEINKGIVPKTN